MILFILYGLHTYSAGMVLTYEQFKKIWDACYETGRVEHSSNIWNGKEKLYCCAYCDQGIKVFLTGKSGKWYRLRVQIEPCRVLGEKDPTALTKLDRKDYTTIKDDKCSGSTQEYQYGFLIYDGEMKKSYRHGKGVSYYYSGQKKYDGQWSYDYYNGSGKLYDENGELIYSGKWKDGDYAS